MKTKNYLLLLIAFILTIGCDDKKNGIVNIKIKDRYEFNNRILTKPLVLEDNKKGTLRLAFVSFRKDDESRIYEVIIYNFDGKQHNSKEIKFIDEEGLTIKAIEVIDRNGDGVDEILVYDNCGRDWVFDQDGNKVKGYDLNDKVYDAEMLLSLDQFEDGKKIVTVTYGLGGKYDKKYLLDVRTPGKNSLKGYPIIFGDDERISNLRLAEENIYIYLFSQGNFLDSYSIDGGKRLTDFPIELHGVYYVNDMCPYKSEDIFFSGCEDENHIYSLYRINLKNKKLDKVEIKDSKSISKIKTGYVDSEEYIYAIDDKDNIVYRINNKNKVIDKLKVDIEESFKLKYYDTFSINSGKETYLFFIYGDEGLMDIEEMFAKYAPASEGKKIEERVYKNYNKTQKLNVEQIKVKEAIIDAKHRYLLKHLGIKKYMSIGFLTPRTKVIIYKNSKDKFEQISSDEISEYVFDMFFGLEYPELRPSIYFNSKLSTLAFIVPLNKKSEDDIYGNTNEKSIIKTYIFSDIK